MLDVGQQRAERRCGRNDRSISLQSAEQPPGDAPERERGRRAGLVRRLPLAIAIQPVAAEHAGHAEHHRAEIRAVEDRLRRSAVPCMSDRIAEARADLQQRAEGARQVALLTHAEPQQAGALDRPHRGGRARVERQRNREAREDDAERGERLDEQAEGLATRANSIQPSSR